MIPEPIRKDVMDFIKAMQTHPKDTVKITLTGRQGKYAGISIIRDAGRKEEE
jgi:hypothetical protein